MELPFKTDICKNELTKNNDRTDNDVNYDYNIAHGLTSHARGDSTGNRVYSTGKEDEIVENDSPKDDYGLQNMEDERCGR